MSRAAAGSMRMSAASTSLWYTGPIPVSCLPRDADIVPGVVQAASPRTKTPSAYADGAWPSGPVQPVLRDAHGGIGIPLRPPRSRPPCGTRRGPPAPAAGAGPTSSLQSCGSGFAGCKTPPANTTTSGMRCPLVMETRGPVPRPLPDRVRQVHLEIRGAHIGPRRTSTVCVKDARECFVRFGGQVGNPVQRRSPDPSCNRRHTRRLGCRDRPGRSGGRALSAGPPGPGCRARGAEGSGGRANGCSPVETADPPTPVLGAFIGSDPFLVPSAWPWPRSCCLRVPARHYSTHGSAGIPQAPFDDRGGEYSGVRLWVWGSQLHR